MCGGRRDRPTALLLAGWVGESDVASGGDREGRPPQVEARVPVDQGVAVAS